MEPRTREWRINLGRKLEDSSIAVKLPSSQKRKTKGSWLWSIPCLSICPFSCVLCPSHGQHVLTRVSVYHCPKLEKEARQTMRQSMYVVQLCVMGFIFCQKLAKRITQVLCKNKQKVISTELDDSQNKPLYQ